MVASDRATSERLADRLGALRDRYFVGRQTELEQFEAALISEVGPAVFFVHGPGGVGKSVLLRQFHRSARKHGASVVTLDGRNFEPSPAGMLGAVRTALELTERDSALESLAELASLVMLIDTYEVLTPLDSWIRDAFLPQLPGSALVVLAGRNAPAPAWRADPAWSELTRSLPLRNLQPRDSRAYLGARGVPDDEHESVLAFTHGHPLALSLLADLLLHDDRARQFRPEQSPDTVRVLLERFVDRVPDAMHWQALAVCAHARVTTEALLASVLGPDVTPAQDRAPAAGAPTPADLFEWLRGLPFVEQSPHGMFPHDLAREVLEADLRWRDPATYAELHQRICATLVGRLQGSRALEQQGAYFDFLYLARHGVVSRAFYDWASFGHLYAEAASEADHATILSLVERHEGPESAQLAAYWLMRQPEAFVVFREAGRQIAGFSGTLLLDTPPSDADLRDPAVRAAWQFVAARANVLRPGERIMHHRFYVGRDAHQDLTIHNMVAMVATLRWLTTPRVAWSFPAVAEPERWAAMFEAIRFPRTPEADFVVGGRTYGAFSHDWRTDPVATWINVKAALDPRALSSAHARPPEVLVLSRPDFEAAVRQALRDLGNSEALARNPLARSRLVVAASVTGSAGSARSAGSAADAFASPAERLRALVCDAANALRGSPRSEKLFRALDATYLRPAATQELAAEHLGLPFNTYRYQLNAAIDRLTNALWELELGA